MAKVRETCQLCGGSGNKLRDADDPMQKCLYGQRILSTFPSQLCPQCGGEGKIWLDVRPEEK